MHHCLLDMHCTKDIEITPVVSVESVVVRMPDIPYIGHDKL